MKKNRILFSWIIILSIGCSEKMYRRYVIEGKTFESKAGPLYRGNELTFNFDSTFTFIGQGPCIFLSKGTWKYDSNSNQLMLNSRSPDHKFINPATLDTLWVEIFNKKVQILSKGKILFDGSIYFSSPPRLPRK